MKIIATILLVVWFLGVFPERVGILFLVWGLYTSLWEVANDKT